MNHFRTGLFLIAAVCCVSSGRDAAPPVAAPPLEIDFKPATSSFFVQDFGVPSCGVPEGRQEIYDPETGTFHIQFHAGECVNNAFEVTKVSERFTRPIIFRLTGAPQGYGCLGQPLALFVDGQTYPLEVSDSGAGFVDKTLFRVDRVDDVVTIAFTEKGQALLKPGARISFTVDFCW